MITEAILSLIALPFIGLFSFLPESNLTVMSSIDTIVDNYIKPMFYFMKVWLPMDTFWFWVSFTLGLHVSIIFLKLIFKVANISTLGIIKADKL